MVILICIWTKFKVIISSSCMMIDINNTFLFLRLLIIEARA